jgi:hypothetical protein
MQGFHDQLSSVAKICRRPYRAAVESVAAAVPDWRASLFALRSPPPVLQRLLAGAALLALAMPRAALAQTATITASPSTGLGNIVAAASGATTFRFEPVSGGVSWQSGNGVRLSTGSAILQVTISCTSNSAPCASGNSKVTVQPSGAHTGRAGSMSRFAVNMGTAKLATGTSLPTPGSPISFTIQRIGKGNTATFTIGADLPLDGDDQLNAEATGPATSGVQVTVSAANGSSATVSTGSMTATVLRTPSLKILNNSALDFGTIVRPSIGSNTISLPASTGTLSVTGAGNAVALHPGAATRVKMELSGEGHQTVSVSVTPSLVTLSSTVGTTTSTLTMVSSYTAQGTQQLSGTAGGVGAATSGTLDFYVGGAFAISSTTPTGVYTGNIIVTAQYN